MNPGGTAASQGTADPLVLVGDDSVVVRRLLEKVLVTHGFRCLLADNGRSILALTRNNHPDVIILDVKMPGMDGFQVLKSIRELESTRNIPVILLSASTDGESVAEGRRLGADHYVAKPFDTPELLARLNLLVGKGN